MNKARVILRSVPTIILGAILIACNIVVLLPFRLTFLHFYSLPMEPYSFDCGIMDIETGTLEVIVSDRMQLLYSGGVSADWPIPLIQRWIDRRRVNHLMRVSNLSVHVEHEDGTERLLGTWAARDVRQSAASDYLRFIVPVVPSLPPGAYNLRVMIFAKQGWGTVDSPGGEHQQAAEFWRRPIFPGQFYLKATVSQPISIVVHDD